MIGLVVVHEPLPAGALLLLLVTIGLQAWAIIAAIGRNERPPDVRS